MGIPAAATVDAAELRDQLTSVVSAHLRAASHIVFRRGDTGAGER